MSKAKIRIEYNGKTYRVGRSHRCASKRDCDLFGRGVCEWTARRYGGEAK